MADQIPTPLDLIDDAERLTLRAALNQLYGQEVEAVQVWRGKPGDTVVGRLTDMDGWEAIVTDDDGVKWTCDPRTVKAAE